MSQAAPDAPDLDTLYLEVNGVRYSGWLDASVTRGIERMPGDFTVGYTESFPNEASGVITKPGDPFRILLGADVVLTGFVDKVDISIGPDGHAFRLSGRGKCQDLVDCSAILTNGNIGGTDVLQLANQMLQPFLAGSGITAKSLAGSGNGQYFYHAANLGETVYEILEPIARFEGLLLYEDADGNLVFDRVGTQDHASGVEQGLNVQAGAVSYSMNERFSVYIACIMSSDRMGDFGTAGNQITRVYDQSVPRFRPRYIVSEQGLNGISYALIRANWELARRRGRSQALTVTIDSWRDSAGLLWQPNYLLPVNIPALKVENQTWIVAEVTYARSAGSGTTAQLVIMPPEAFTVEPPMLQTVLLAVQQELEANTQATVNSGGEGHSH